MNTVAPQLAVLIDADNITATVADRLMREAASLGMLCTVRVYGDWTTDRLKKWKEPMQRHAMLPIQQLSHSRGKNSTDIALVIDAMDLLHEGRMDAFCLVSSDSDFTRLAQRIRSSGRTVYGFGGVKASAVLVAACSRFFSIEGWDDATQATPARPAAVAKTKGTAKQASTSALPPRLLQDEKSGAIESPRRSTTKSAAKAKANANAKPSAMTADLRAQLRAAFEHCKNPRGDASENAMKDYLGKLQMGFTADRPFGYTSMSALLSVTKEFDLTVQKGTPNRKRDHLVRLRIAST